MGTDLSDTGLFGCEMSTPGRNLPGSLGVGVGQGIQERVHVPAFFFCFQLRDLGQVTIPCLSFSVSPFLLECCCEGPEVGRCRKHLL